MSIESPPLQQQHDLDKGEATARAFGDAVCVGGNVDGVPIIPNANLYMSHLGLN